MFSLEINSWQNLRLLKLGNPSLHPPPSTAKFPPRRLPFPDLCPSLSSMAFFSGGGRFRELLRKYGKVAIGVHFSVSAASITGLYVAIKNNVDVESLLDKLHMDGFSSKDQPQTSPSEITSSVDDGSAIEESEIQSTTTMPPQDPRTRNRTAELAASTGGALALAMLCNKALFPIRIPITIALTPPIARILARRGIMRSG